MACKKYIYAAGDTSWVTTFMEAVEKSWKGMNNTSLTEYTTTAVCAIAEGSVMEIAGSTYIATSNTAITASVATGICYIYATGSAGGSVFAWDTTNTPIWRGDYQGYYQSAASTIRAIGGCYYLVGSYIEKWVYREQDDGLYTQYENISFENTAGGSVGYVYYSGGIGSQSFGYYSMSVPHKTIMESAQMSYSAASVTVHIKYIPWMNITTAMTTIQTLINTSAETTIAVPHYVDKEANKYWIATDQDTSDHVWGLRLKYVGRNLNI